MTVADGSGPVLVVLAGLPGTGKSRVAAELSHLLGAAVVSVDPIEAAMVRAGVDPSQPVGLAAYVVAEAVAADELARGRTVVVDAVNAVIEARDQWRALAARREVALRWVEVVCSDPELHRARLENRGERYPEIPEPAWDEVQRIAVGFLPWTETDDHLVVDTAGDVAAALAPVTAWTSMAR